MWIQLALFVVSLVISQVLQPKPLKPKPAAFDEFDFPTTEDGTPQIVVFGDVWLTDWTVLAVGNYRTTKIQVKQKGLFGSKKTTTGYRYYMSLLMGLCRGIDDLVEIKVSDKSAWKGTLAGSGSNFNIDQPKLFGGDSGEGGIVGTLRVCLGATNQPVLGQLSTLFGKSPAYRGVVTFFYDGLMCSNSPYPKAWSFRVRRVTEGWEASTWYAAKAVIWLKNNSIKAMNPAHIIYEAQTNTAWGRGFIDTQIDIDSFKKAADQLYDEKFGLCLAWRRQDNLSNFIQQIVDQIGAALYVDRTTGLWRLTLIRDNYNVTSLTEYNYSNGLLSIEEDNNTTNDLATNQTIVTYSNPETNIDETIRAENLASIQKYGLISETKNYVGIPTADLAGRIAARDMKIAQSGLKKFKLVFNRSAYDLQPVSVFKISLPERGIDSIVVRAIRVEHSTLTDGQITVTVVQDVFGLPATNYIQEQPSLWQAPDLSAKPVSKALTYEVPYFELLDDFTSQQIQELANNNQSYLAVVAQQPSPLQQDFDIYCKTSNEVNYIDVGDGQFAVMSEITSEINQTALNVEIALQSVESISVGDRAILNTEIMRVDAVNPVTNTITVARGCIDTNPIKHNIGSELWIYSQLTNAADRAFKVNEIVNLKLVTNTSKEHLLLDLAPVMNYTMNNRLKRPYSPANVKVNNAYFPNQVSGDLQLTWSHRNRLIQTTPASWIESQSVEAEGGTTYKVKILDATQIVLLDELVPGTSINWSVPKKFDGEMTTILNIAMTGTDNSISFTDTSANSHVINNYNSIIRSDTSATGGSSATFDVALLRTTSEANKLNIYDNDHCIEFRVKTASATDYLGADPNTMYIRIDHERAVAENISTLYKSLSITSYTDAIKLSLNGSVFESGWIGTDKSVTCNVSGLNSNQYYDVALQAISKGTVTVEGTVYTKFMITIFVGGIAQVSDYLFIKTHGYPCSVKLSLDPNYTTGSLLALNALRITKRTGGRYSANYTPENYPVGSSDPHWNDVALLIQMNGTNGSHAFSDVSINPLTLTATNAVAIKTDASAHGGSAAYFYFSMLSVAAHDSFNLRNTSFSIEGRAKGNGEIFTISDCMSLKVDGYSLTLTNAFNSNPTNQQTIQLNHTLNVANEYFSFKIMRDAGTGQTTLWMNNLNKSGLFNPWQATATPNISIGLFNRDTITLNRSYFNGLKIETAAVGSGLVPNVVNPLQVELSAVRDDLESYQKVKMQFDIVS